ncbi:MAG TPA: hypothetical protein VFN68_05295 [Acidimicrobiales bacterium]|nr:hypothetical protein [Acidimicrobiales bacterium]
MIRSIAGHAGQPVVTSLYLDVDGRRRPRWEDLENAVNHLLRRARRLADRRGPDTAAAVDADLAAITGHLAGGLDRTGFRGVAVFSSAGDGWLQTVEIPVPVRDRVAVGDRPDVSPLLEVLDKAPRYLMVLVDRQESRLVHARLGRMEEQPGPTDPVERQVDNDVELGSWERRQRESVNRHLRRVAAAVAHDQELTPADAVLIGGSPEAVEGLVPLLPRPLADRVIEVAGLPVRAARTELAEAIQRIDRQREERLEEELLSLVGDRIGTGRGVGGLDATLDALADQRVSTLVVRPGYSAPGFVCPACGHLGATTSRCPRCGASTEAVEDVVDAAIDRAMAQHAAVEFCSAPGLDDLGGVAAIERY